jgi:hypothetical protein
MTKLRPQQTFKEWVDARVKDLDGRLEHWGEGFRADPFSALEHVAYIVDIVAEHHVAVIYQRALGANATDSTGTLFTEDVFNRDNMMDARILHYAEVYRARAKSPHPA